MSEHTKGEWQIADEDKRFVFATDKDGYNAFTCLVQGGSAFIGELEANARLIATAPKTKQQRDDLLAACEEVVATFVGLQPGSIGWQVTTKINQAIAKAKK